MSIHVPQTKEQVFFYKLAESTQLFLVQVYELAGRQVTQWSEAVAEELAVSEVVFGEVLVEMTAAGQVAPRDFAGSEQ